MDERRIQGVLEGFLAAQHGVARGERQALLEHHRLEGFNVVAKSSPRVGVVIFAGVGLGIGAQPAAVHALLFQS